MCDSVGVFHLDKETSHVSVESMNMYRTYKPNGNHLQEMETMLESDKLLLLLLLLLYITKAGHTFTVQNTVRSLFVSV